MRMLPQMNYIGLISLGILLIYSYPSYAEGWYIKPEVSLTGMFDDNYNLETGPANNTYGSLLSGAITVKRVTDTSEINGFVQTDFNYYASDKGKSVPNETNQYFTLSGKHKTELSQLDLSAQVIRDTTLTTQLLSTQNNIDVGLVQVSRRRHLLSLTPSWHYKATERSEYSLDYKYTKVTFDKKENTGLYDYYENDFSGSYQYDLTERDKISATLDYGFYKASSIDNKFDSYGLSLDLKHSFTETMYGIFSIGQRKTYFTTAAEKNSNTGYLLNVGIVKNTELTVYNFSIRRNIYPSGAGDMVESDQLNLNINKRFSPKLLFYFRTQLFKNKSLLNQSFEDRRYFMVQPSLHWYVSRWWYIEGAYTYRQQKIQGDIDTARSNAAYIGVGYSHSNFALTNQ